MKNNPTKIPASSLTTVNMDMVTMINLMVPKATLLQAMEAKKSTNQTYMFHSRHHSFKDHLLITILMIFMVSCSQGGGGLAGAVAGLIMLPFNLLGSALNMALSNPVGTAAAASAFTN